ncbi:MAG TPA: PVC-type heme-binding CxxCH protein [Gemmataceae bacterium]
MTVLLTRFLQIASLFTFLAASPCPAGAAEQKTPPSRRPLTPTEARAAFRVAPGLRVELVAAEPDIESPVAMAFDEDGRLWVVEMRDYPNGPGKGRPPEGRIKVLEDRDGDGHYENSKVFADQLLFANGLLPWKGGVVVTAAPSILYLEDTRGAGKADRHQVLYEGFAARNPQLRVSHPLLGLDNWIYVANGLRGGKVVRSGQTDAKPIDLSGRDFRFDLIGDRAEAISGMGQFGNTFDDWGRRFVCDNRNHLRHIVLPERYLRRNPFLAVPAVLNDISELEIDPAGGGAPIYPLSTNWTTSNRHAGRFTASCGVFVYRGTLLPEAFRHSAFTCEPTGNLIHQEVLRPSGATFRSRPPREKVEFLATRDDWCRPVFLTHGPEGALYVVDMYRAVIEHPEFMPPELKNRPDLLLGKDKGRIWRIVPESYQAKPPRPRLSKATTRELVAHLSHSEPWWRTTAQRLLLERQDRDAVAPLRELCLSGKNPQGRVLAAWLLENLKALDEQVVLHLLRDEHPGVRENAVQLSEPRLAGSARLQERLVALARDPDARVRFQVALSLGEWDDDHILPALAEIALTGAEDRWTRAAVASAVPRRAGKLLVALLEANPGLTSQVTSGRLALFRELTTLIGSRREPEEVVAVLDALGALKVKERERWQMTGLLGLTEGMGRRGTSLNRFLAGPPERSPKAAQVVERLLTRAAATSADARASVAERVAATHLLAHAAPNAVIPTLERLLEKESTPELRRAAVQTLATFDRPEVPKILMAAWPTCTPVIRQEIVNAMLAQPDRVAALLDEIEAQRVQPHDIAAAGTRRLIQHPKADLRERARKLLSAGSADRQKVIESYRAALTRKADSGSGRDVFRQHCASCHRIADLGTQVGPDISDLRTKTAETLLQDILAPNAAIDANYLSYEVTTKAGKQFTGIIKAETASSITLARGEGQTDVVLRQDIEEVRSTGQSLMPEGLEKNISVDQMADLLAFLKNWRYREGTPPEGAPR